jgi:hypothetical protein
MKKFITRWTTAGILLEVHDKDPLIAFDEMERVGGTMVRYEAGVGYGIINVESMAPRDSLKQIDQWTKESWSWLPWWRRALKKWTGDEIKKPAK